MRILSSYFQEYALALSYYKEVGGAVAENFARAVDSTLVRVEAFPGAGRLTSGYRRIFVQGFPYSIHYTVEKNGQVVAHLLWHHKKAAPKGGI